MCTVCVCKGTKVTSRRGQESTGIQRALVEVRRQGKTEVLGGGRQLVRVTLCVQIWDRTRVFCERPVTNHHSHGTALGTSSDRGSPCPWTVLGRCRNSRTANPKSSSDTSSRFSEFPFEMKDLRWACSVNHLNRILENPFMSRRGQISNRKVLPVMLL